MKLFIDKPLGIDLQLALQPLLPLKRHHSFRQIPSYKPPKNKTMPRWGKSNLAEVAAAAAVAAAATVGANDENAAAAAAVAAAEAAVSDQGGPERRIVDVVE